MTAALPSPELTPASYASPATFHQALRRFVHFSTAVNRQDGPTTQRQALLAIKGVHVGPMTISSLIDGLLVALRTTAELVSRLEAASLVTRVADLIFCFQPAQGRALVCYVDTIYS